jgi:hypothetical protein
VDVVPARFSLADDGDVLCGEDEVGELVGLAGARVRGASAASLSRISILPACVV